MQFDKKTKKNGKNLAVRKNMLKKNKFDKTQKILAKNNQIIFILINKKCATGLIWALELCPRFI